MKQISAITQPLARLSQPQGAYKIPALRILSEISTGLATENNIEALLERFLGTMVRLSGADAGAVRILTADGKHLRLLRSVGLPAEVLEHERLISLECGTCGEALRDARAHCSTSIQVCSDRTHAAFFGDRCQRVVAVPLRHQGRVLGVYNLFLGGDRNVPEEVELLFNSIGEHLGMALENARLTRENLRATLMIERQMLANEIHDSIAQTLAYTKMRLSLLQDAMTAENTEQSFAYLDEVREAMDTAYSSLRQLLANFRNRMDPRGLLPALQDTISMIRGKTGIDIQFVNRAPDMILTPDQEVQVFHIVQEALANIGKHSQASRAKVQIDSRRDDYVITIEDNGVGVPASDIPGKGVHFGMNIMRERAQRLSGTVSVARRPRKGTRIRLTFPAALCRQETRS